MYKEVEFPAVSFCNLNPLRRSQLYLEENVDLVDVIATLDQATEDQLSGVSQSSRRRRRSRRTVDDDVTATLEPPMADLPLVQQPMKQVIPNTDRPQNSESDGDDDGNSDSNHVTTRRKTVTDDYWTTSEPTSAVGQEWPLHSEDVIDDVNADESRDAMAVQRRRRR